MTQLERDAAEWRRALTEGAARLGVSLDERQQIAFVRYLELLRRWNAKIKLTSVTAPAEVLEKHFLDSLAVVPAVRGVATLVDVGAGAGFPGVPVALAEPNIRVVAVESIRKKAAFLEALRRELGIANLEVAAERMEQLVASGRRFEAAVSRATFAPAEWVRRGAELVAPGGRLVAMVVPEPGRGVDDLAPDGAADWESATLEPPYATGRALLVLRGRRVPRGTPGPR